MNFTTEQFYSFSKLINKNDFDDSAMPFPDETERILIRMPNKEVSMAFAEKEWENLREVVNEALFMHQIHELLE